MRKPKAMRGGTSGTPRPAHRHAAYIAQMAAQLANMAERDNLPLAAYFLRMAHLEASARARQDVSG